MNEDAKRRLRERGPALAALAALTVAACATLPPGPAYDLAGSWAGGIQVQDAPLSGTLEVVQTGRDLAVVFSFPDMGIRAEGTGAVTDGGEVSMELSYNMQCAGTAVLTGTVSENASRMSGTLRASDCTGTLDGSFSYAKR